jgi:hypothetical protein
MAYYVEAAMDGEVRRHGIVERSRRIYLAA